MWIGGSATERGGVWKWVTGEPFEYQHWGPNKPDGLSSDGKPVSPPYGLGFTQGAVWHDFKTTYSGSAGFLVEWDDAGGTPVAPAEAWVRVWNLPEEHDSNSQLTVEDGWVVARGAAQEGRRSMSEQWHDCAIRAEFRWVTGKKPSSLWLRTTGKAKYTLVRSKDGVQLAYFLGDEQGKIVLKEYPVSNPKDGDTYSLELRAVGRTQIGKLDGREVIRVEDDKLTIGGPGLYVYEKGGMRNIEVLNLDKAATSDRPEK